MSRIRPATVSLGVVAVLLGLVAAYTARRYFEPAPVAKSQGVAIVVPRVNLPPYARIRDIDVEIAYLPADQVPADAIKSRNQSLFRFVRQTIMAGEPIREERLYEIGKLPTLAEQLPPGHRAVTVAIEANDALDGVLLPESFVDISLTVKGNHPELAGVATLTLLRHVKVMATNRDRYRTEERLESPLRSVTLAVTPEQANKLILAQRYGTLSVALRSEVDELQVASNNDRDMVNPNDLLGLEPVRPRTVEIWRGTGVEQVTFETRQIREAEEATAVFRRQDTTPATPTSLEIPTASVEPAPITPQVNVFRSSAGASELPVDAGG